MTRHSTFHDIELLSCYLDGQLNDPDRLKLETRLNSDKDLNRQFTELKQAKSLIRNIQPKKVPRNFTLSPRMVGIKPPIPRAFPVFRFASVAAAIILFLSFSINQVMSFSRMMPASAPQTFAVEIFCADENSTDCFADSSKMASQEGIGGGPPEEPALPTEQAVMALAPSIATTPTLPGSPLPEMRIAVTPTPQAVESTEQVVSTAELMATTESALTPTESLPTATEFVPTPTESAPALTEFSPLRRWVNQLSIPEMVYLGSGILFLVFGIAAIAIRLISLAKWRKQQ